MKKLLFYLPAIAICFISVTACKHCPDQPFLSSKDSSAIWNAFNKSHHIPPVYKPRWGDVSNWSMYMTKDDANKEIANYLTFVYNTAQDVEVRSFFINADTLRNYLNRNRNVTDIQVFGALNEIDGIIRREYVFIGVDKATKRHIYTKDPTTGKDCVFENCLPCPSFCDRANDNGGRYTLE